MPSNNVKPTPRSSGPQSVTYRDTKGRMRDAIVTGGSAAAPNLRIPGGGGSSRTLTAVAKGTSAKRKGTNVWFPTN